MAERRSEIKISKTSRVQRTLASIFFVSMVIGGMQIATQQVSRAQTATPPPTPNATMTTVGTSDAVSAGPAPYNPPPPPPPAPAPAPVVVTPPPTSAPSGDPNMAPANGAATNGGAANPAMANGQPSQIGDAQNAKASAAQRSMMNMDPDMAMRPSPTPGEAFVPSEVERYIPGAERVGDSRAILRTSLGDITIRLFSDRAPHTVRNFIDLARGERDFVDARTSKHTHRPFYSDLTFHRVLPPYLIQTGCPFGTGRGGPGYTIPDEISRTLTFDKPGMVAMAPERGPKGNVKDSNGSQFFITLQPMPSWTGNYTIFGEVERGMSVVEKIAGVATGPTDRPIRKVYLKQVEIIDEATAKLLPAAK